MQLQHRDAYAEMTAENLITLYNLNVQNCLDWIVGV